MKNIFAKIAFVIVFLSVAGCAGDCIKVGGNYADDGKQIGGNFEYCFDKPSSDSNKTPVLKDGAGVKYMLLSEPEAQKLIAADPDAKAASALPFWELKKRIAEKK